MSTKTASIFAYKEHLGATTDLKNGKFLNDPTSSGQLGCVISSKEVQITPEAKKLLKQSRREGGSFAEVMLTKHSDGSGSSIGIIGFGKHYLGSKVSIGRDCDISVLDDAEEVEFPVPDDFKNFIDEKGE